MTLYNKIFLDRMQHLLRKDYQSFLKSLESENEKAIFVNQNKIKVENFKNIVDFDIKPIPYEKAGFYVDNQKKGRHPLHHCGAFYMQEPSAMFTVNCMQFKGDEKVLDMCAAPGGKTIQLANRVPNGVVVSNEYNKARSEILFSNIERMGLKNVIITNEDSKNLAKAYSGCFDVVLVDTPCSGEGMFRKGAEIVEQWSPNHPIMCQERQLDILQSADKVLKQNGYLIYSTCTYSLEENEQVVKQFLQNHDYQPIDIDAPFTRGVDLTETVRLYPHIVKGEGQFVALLRKKSPSSEQNYSNVKFNEDKKAQDFFEKHTKNKQKLVSFKNFAYYVPDFSLIKKDINYVSIGVRIGESKQARFEPHHNLYTAFGNQFVNKLELDFNDGRLTRYLKGETFDVDLPDGYGAIIVNGCALGGFKISAKKFKNHYPKGLRNFK